MQIEIPPIVDIFGPLNDWRRDKGKRYALISLLGFIILGLLCGKKGARAMARWGQSLPASCRQRVGFHPERSPSAAMLCRVLWNVRVETLEANIEAWARTLHQQLVSAGVSKGIAIDGKSIRRAASLGSKNVHLLSAVCHQVRFVLKQLAVDDKTNEITTVPPLLEKLLLEGMVITVDALLTQREIAKSIRQRQGHYLMYVKDNQPKLLWAIRMLFEQPPKPGVAPPLTAKVVSSGHGRVEVRKLCTSPALNHFLDWPGVQQVFRLTRQRLRLKDGRFSESTVYGITSLSVEAASPEQLIAITRDHWAAIENGTHWVRDVVMGEDASTVRKETAPQTFAALRNLALALARLAGFDSFTAALDAFSANPHQALKVMGL
jgi:predicted transposase YbfD/YdcC